MHFVSVRFICAPVVIYNEVVILVKQTVTWEETELRFINNNIYSNLNVGNVHFAFIFQIMTNRISNLELKKVRVSLTGLLTFY